MRLKTQPHARHPVGPVVQGLLVFAGAAAVLAAMLHNGQFRAPPQVAAAAKSTTVVDDSDEGVT